MKELTEERCPLCLATSKKEDYGQQASQLLHRHKRLHALGYYRAKCIGCERLLDEIIHAGTRPSALAQAFQNYESHMRVIHATGELFDVLWPGAKVAT